MVKGGCDECHMRKFIYKTADLAAIAFPIGGRIWQFLESCLFDAKNYTPKGIIYE